MFTFNKITGVERSETEKSCLVDVFSHAPVGKWLQTQLNKLFLQPGIVLAVEFTALTQAEVKGELFTSKDWNHILPTGNPLTFHFLNRSVGLLQ